MQTKLGTAAVLLAGLGYSSTAVLVIKAYQGGATPWQLLLCQNTITVLILAGVLFFRRKHLRLPLRDFLLLVLIGVCGLASTAGCYTLALQYLPGSVASLLFFTYPIYVTIGARLVFHEPFTLGKMFALLSALTGVALTAGVYDLAPGSTSLWGVFLCLIAAVATASSILLAQHLLKRHNPLDLSILQLFFAAGALIILIWGNNAASYGDLPNSIWRYGLLLSVLTSVLPTFLTYAGVFYLGAYRVSLVSVTEIPFTLLMVFIFLGDSLAGVQWLGSMLIFGSLLLVNRR